MGMFNLFGKFSNKKWPSISADEIRKRSRILVIDDEDFLYFDLFERNGYNIRKWNDIEDLEKLVNAEYDVILLDIQGIGKDFSPEQGLGVLKYIKEKDPTQIVVAYSAADYFLKYQDFFHIADDTLDKTSDFFVFKTKVDNLLKRRHSMSFYIEKVASKFDEIMLDKEKLAKVTQDAILSGKPGKLASFLDKNDIKNKDLVGWSLQIVNIATSLLRALLTSS